MKQEEIQQAMMIFQVLQKHAEELRQQVMAISQKAAELEGTQQILADFAKVRDKNEILMPVGSGFYTRASVTDRKTLVASIGANLAIEKPVAESLKLVEDQKAEIDKLLENATMELEQTTVKIQELAPVIQMAIAQMQGGQQEE